MNEPNCKIMSLVLPRHLTALAQHNDIDPDIVTKP